ncbi:hypothetical protein [Archangium lipolyticum]|uniref:hypothetical protein n=1 Tax=Archangium lipolyticum TaxID=2970465 RepID=UPI00214A6DB1|nr:hypothetical protein [Archangium lipolyticum]
MKKFFIFLFASIAWSACGGTIDVDEQSGTRTQTLDYSCPQGCACKQCGWECLKTFNEQTSTWVYRTRLTTCSNSSECSYSSNVVYCAAPCVPGQFYAEPCPSI